MQFKKGFLGNICQIVNKILSVSSKNPIIREQINGSK